MPGWAGRHAGLLVSCALAFLAMANAYLGRTGDAEAAGANVVKLDPAWNAERYLSEAGGYAEKESELFVNGARKAGLPACIPADKLKDMVALVTGGDSGIGRAVAIAWVCSGPKSASMTWRLGPAPSATRC